MILQNLTLLHQRTDIYRRNRRDLLKTNENGPFQYEDECSDFPVDDSPAYLGRNDLDVNNTPAIPTNPVTNTDPNHNMVNVPERRSTRERHMPKKLADYTT